MGMDATGDGGGVSGIESEGSCTGGGGRSSITAIGASMGPNGGKGLLFPPSDIGDVGRGITVDGRRSTCSKIGTEACEVQRIIKDCITHELAVGWAKHHFIHNEDELQMTSFLDIEGSVQQPEWD